MRPAPDGGRSEDSAAARRAREEEEAVLQRKHEEEAREKLYGLLKDESSPANPKVVRMMLGRDFAEQYRIVDLQGDYVHVQTSSGIVRVHLRHGSNELYENLEFATDRHSRHGYEIDLCEKFEDGKGADSFNRTLQRFEEYKRNKQGTLNSFDMNIKDAAKQADVIVLEVPDNISFDTLSKAIRNRSRRAQNIQDIIILWSEKEATYNRSKFRKDDFKIQPDDFK